MQVNPINNNQKNANFKAKMQLKGCTNLLKNEQIKSLENIIEKFGSKTDIVDINLSEKLTKQGFIPVAIFANSTLEQFLGEFKNSDIYSGIMNAFDKAKEIFPALAAITTIATVVAVDDKKEKVVQKEAKTQTENKKIIKSNAQIGVDDFYKTLAPENNIAKEIDDFIYAWEDLNNNTYDLISKNYPIIKTVKNFIKSNNYWETTYKDYMNSCEAHYPNSENRYFSGKVNYFTGDDEIDKQYENWGEAYHTVIYQMLVNTKLRKELLKLSPEELKRFEEITKSEVNHDEDLYDEDMYKNIIEIKEAQAKANKKLVVENKEIKTSSKSESIETTKQEKVKEANATKVVAKDSFGTDKYEIINKEIDKFINNFRFYSNDNSIEYILKNSIRNDSELYDEYTKRMQEKKYSYYDEWRGELFKDNYTGYEIKDAFKSNKWKNDSIEIIYRMLNEANLKEKITLASLNFLNENQLLNNFDVVHLEDTCTMLNEKFEEWLKLCKREYKNNEEYYEIKTHPVPVCIWNTVTSSDSELSKYLINEFNSYNYSKEKDEDLRKAYIIEDLLKREQECFWKEQLFSLLILNYPGKIPADEHKDLLDKISQSTVKPRVAPKQLTEEEMRKSYEAAQKTLWRILDSM